MEPLGSLGPKGLSSSAGNFLAPPPLALCQDQWERLLSLGLGFFHMRRLHENQKLSNSLCQKPLSDIPMPPFTRIRAKPLVPTKIKACLAHACMYADMYIRM